MKSRFRFQHDLLFSFLSIVCQTPIHLPSQKKRMSECVCMGKILTMCTFEWLLTDNNIQLTLSFRLLHNFSSQHFSWENSFILILFIGLEWKWNEIYSGLLNWESNKYIEHKKMNENCILTIAIILSAHDVIYAQLLLCAHFLSSVFNGMLLFLFHPSD